jgi:hypothetical protein
MTRDELAEALSRLVGEAEDAGLDPEVVPAKIEGMAEAMRLWQRCRLVRAGSAGRN